MNTSKKRRILGIAPVAVAVVLSLAACGAPCMAGSSGAPASNGASSSGALSNTSASSNGSVASNGTGAGSSSAGASGLGASGGSASGGSAAGGSAVGGQGGVSSGGSASAGSATPGQSGVSSGGFGASNPAAGMTPDQVATYCTKFPDDPASDWGYTDKLNGYTAVRKVTPVQLVPNVDAEIADYQALIAEKRVFAQLKDEMVANYGPLKDFHDQICVAH
jgi:hypothetical protein